jgi:hypothetical protein
MNIYTKIQNIKEKLLEANLKKTGENKYAGFSYYELADFLPTIIKLCNEEKLFTKITFSNEEAFLTIVNAEKPEEKETYTSPMRELELKGCNSIQALGGVETYQRRYLYMSAFDIVENDMFDAQDTKTEKELLITNEQLVYIEETATDEQKEKILANYKKKNLKELTITQASTTILMLKDILNREEK